MKSIGFITMQIALIVFISCGAADVLLTFILGSSSYLANWQNAVGNAPSGMVALDQIMARTVGTFFVLLGLSGQIILHEMVRVGSKRGLVYLIGLLSVGVFIYVMPMTGVTASQTLIPILSLTLLLIGAALWYFHFPFSRFAK